MAFTQSPSLSNNLKILTNYLICTDTEKRMPEDRSKRDRIENWGRRRDHEIKECQTTLHQIAHPACNPQSGNQGQQDVYVRKRSNSALSKEEQVPFAFTILGSNWSWHTLWPRDLLVANVATLRCFRETQENPVSGIRWFLRLGQKLRLSGFCFERIAQLCEIEIEPNYFPWSQFVNLLLSSCLVHLWDYLGSTTYVVPCLVIYQERIVSTTPIGFQKKLKSRWTWTEGTRPSSWSTNWTDLYYKHKHKRRPVISQIPSCFFCLPKCNFAQRSSDEHSSNLLFSLECTREYKW